METGAGDVEAATLGVHDCWKYLQSAAVCRIAFTRGGGVEIFPVNFVPSNGTLLIRTGEGTALDAVADGRQVSLEADGLNQYGTIAWSVVVKGNAAAVDDPGEFAEADEAGLSTWQAGPKNRLIRVTPAEISGRRFVIAPPARWAPPEPAGQA